MSHADTISKVKNRATLGFDGTIAVYRTIMEQISLGTGCLNISKKVTDYCSECHAFITKCTILLKCLNLPYCNKRILLATIQYVKDTRRFLT